MDESKTLVPGITTLSSENCRGLWVSEQDKTIGLVDQKGVGLYLVIWQDHIGRGLPLAITADGVQLPTPDQNQKFIEWETLYEMAQLHKVFKRQPQ